MVQPHGRLAAFVLAVLLTGAGLPAGAQDARPAELPRAPDGTPFVIELYPEKYNTPYLRETFGHLLYLAPRRPPVDAGAIVGRLLEELTNRSRGDDVQRAPTYCLYQEPGAPEFERNAWERVKERGIQLTPVTRRQRDVAVRSGECVLVTVAAAPVEDLPPPFLEVEQRVFETADARVILRGRVTAAGGYGQLYLDNEQIPMDRKTGEIDVGLVMPEPGKEVTRELFALDRQKQQSNTVLLTLRRLDIPPPYLEVEQRVFESEDPFVVLRGRVTAAAGYGPLYLDKEEIAYDRRTGAFERRLAMPEPGEEATHQLFALDQEKQESETVRLTLRRIEIPPPRIYDYTSEVKSKDPVGMVYGFVRSRRPLQSVTVDGAEAKLDRDRGYFEAAITLPEPGAEPRLIAIEARDVDGRRDAKRVALVRLAPEPAPVAPPVILADRTRISSRDETVEITGRVESELAVAVVRVGDVPAALDGKAFRARVAMPAPFEGASLLVTAVDAEGNRAEPLSVTLERLPWCPAGLLDSRGEVRRVQELLNGLGYDAGPADGAYGPRTGTAIDAFWQQAAGRRDCTRDDLLAELQDATGGPPPAREEDPQVTEVPEPPAVREPPARTPATEDTAPQQPPRETAPPSLRFDGEPISAWDSRATVTGHALGDLTGWRLVFDSRPVPVAADGSFRFPVDGLACGSNWLQATLLGPGGQALPSRFEVRRSSSLGTWYCHAASAPPWFWLLPAVLLLLAAVAVVKLRKPAKAAPPPRIRLEAARGADFSAEVLPGPRLNLALRREDEVQTTEVILPEPPARLKEAAG